jgi:UDP:flavonoid glycosyltransferase YjiC (YdhE family)
MARILMAASPIYGHFTSFGPIAQHLKERGHDVTLLSSKNFRGMVGPGIRFRSFTGEADVSAAALAMSSERQSLAPGPAQFAWDMANVFVKQIAGQHRDLQRCLAEAGREPVVLVHEALFLGAAPSLMGAPGPRATAAVGLGPVPFSLSSADTGPFGMGLPPDSSEEGRTRNREANRVMQEQILGTVQDLFERTLTELGVPQGAMPFFLDSTVLGADRFLQLSVEELSYRRTDTPPHVKFIGTLPPAVQTQELPEWWTEVTRAERVAVVTQGTVANQHFADLIEPTLQGLADFPGLVIAATGRPGELRDVPANAKVVEFVPFDDLLPHTDVLVTNGGFGAVQQALRHGVPMVAAGLTEDKLESNTRLASTGAGINLAADRPAAADIRTAVDTVLSTASYKENAQRLAAEYAKTDALGDIEKTISELATRTPHA